jgi:hypothetical protein
MAGHPLHSELAAVRALVADGLAGIGGSGDAGQIWLRTAHARLTALDTPLAEAAGVPSAPVRVAAMTAMTFLVVAGSAALAAAAGLAAGGVLAVAGLAVAIGLAATAWAGPRAYAVVGRWRLARRARPAAVPSGPGEVPDVLLRARVRLVSAALRHAGTGNWTTPQLRRAIRTDPVVRRLAHADLLLCQAIDCVERFVGDVRKDVP